MKRITWLLGEIADRTFPLLALCGILFCFGYVGSATDWLHRAWGIYGIVIGSVAFFFLAGFFERDDDDYDD